MTLALDDRWLWDFWTAQDGGRLHVFYLQAQKSLGDPDLRHWNVSIGHAVSADMERWEILPDAWVLPRARLGRPLDVDGKRHPDRRRLANALHRHHRCRAGAGATHRPGNLP
ncbi:MAG: hypothetical protein R2878_07030 [Thermoleophilia bacterium]